jgi:3',5'-cyclic AMP phosphodiesterase CpdA
MLRPLSAVLARIALTFLLCSAGIAADDKMPALKPLPGTGDLASASDSDHFTFVVAGDNRPAHSGDPQPPIAGAIFAAVKKLGPAFVLWTGDTISGKAPTHPKRIKKQYKEFLDIAKTAKTPVFNAPGNHEMDDGNNVPNADMLALYTEHMGLPYGAFSYGNSRFIALNSEEEPPTTANAALAAAQSKPAKPDKSEAPGYIDADQLAALKKDLDDNKDKAHVFIFMHHPVKPAKAKDGLDPVSVQALEDLFKNYSNVSYVFSGHEHMYYNPQSKSGIGKPPGRTDPSQPPDYLVSGGAGAPLKKLPGGFYHYLVFTVDKGKVSVQLIKVQ